MMRCPECRAETVREVRDHHYTECGLSFVYISNIDVDVCPNCGSEFVNIPAMADLHRSLADFLITASERLNGEEIRFLRKHLGWGADDFARFVGVSEDVVRSWESGASEMTPVQEALLRLHVANGQPKASYAPSSLVGMRSAHKPKMLTARQTTPPAWMIEAAVGTLAIA